MPQIIIDVTDGELRRLDSLAGQRRAPSLVHYVREQLFAQHQNEQQVRLALEQVPSLPEHYIVTLRHLTAPDVWKSWNRRQRQHAVRLARRLLLSEYHLYVVRAPATMRFGTSTFIRNGYGQEQ